MQISPHGDAMNWIQAIHGELLAVKSDLKLIIVGETKDGQPFCLEESVSIQKLNPEDFTVQLEFVGINPLEKLDHVSFIECSFHDRGILYFAFIQLIQLEIKKNGCILTLTAPEEFTRHQSRKYTRMHVPLRTPITARIMGTRGQSILQGIAFTGQILDISAGGLSFIAPYRLFYPLFLELSFLLPNHPDKFVIYGEIVRVANFSNDSYRIAVEFINNSETVINEIDAYCSDIT